MRTTILDAAAPTTASGRSRWLVPLAFLAFVSLGLPDGVLGVAWPSVRHTFGRPVDHLGFVLLTMMSGYLCSSASAGALVQRLGVGRLLLTSGLAVATSALVWALSPFWPLVVASGFLTGLGAGAIDAGINAFAASHFTPRVTTWLHACWGLGAMLGPLAMTATLAAGLGWRVGYAELALALVLLSIGFRLTLRVWDTAPAGGHGTGDEAALPAPVAAAPPRAAPRVGEALGSARVRLRTLLFFAYTGVEAGAGQWAFTLLSESRGMGREAAGLAASLYWASILVGRIGFGALAHHVAPERLLRAVTRLAPLAALALVLTRGGSAGFAALFALGLLLSPVFPLLIAETPARVGPRHAAHAIGFQISAGTLGAGTLPSLAGVLMRRFSLEALGPYLVSATLLVLLLRELEARTREPGA